MQRIHHQLYLCVLPLYWLGQTRDKEHTYLTAVTESEGERISYHCSLRCIRRPIDNRQKPQTHMQLNSESIWNDSLVTKSVLISINLQTTSASLVSLSIQFWQQNWTYLSTEWSVNLDRQLEKPVMWQSGRRHGARDCSRHTAWKLCLRVIWTCCCCLSNSMAWILIYWTLRSL